MFDHDEDEGLDLTSGAAQAFPFNNIGDTVTGVVVDYKKQNQTDMETGEVKTFKNGDPMPMFRVVLQTELRDTPEDDGLRTIYIRGGARPETKSMMAATIAALRAAGVSKIVKGGKLSVTYSGNGTASKRGYNPPKEYTAQYAPPQSGQTAPVSAGTAANPPGWQQPAGQTAEPPF